MNYLNGRFEEAYKVFKDTLADIRAGTMTKNDVFKQLEDYWWNVYTDEQSRDEKPVLKQSRIYSFGNDLYGAIYDAYGLDLLFDCVRNPLRAVECFENITGK